MMTTNHTAAGSGYISRTRETRVVLEEAAAVCYREDPTITRATDNAAAEEEEEEEEDDEKKG